jgi:hypothetical protein
MGRITYPIYEMESKKCVKPPTRDVDVPLGGFQQRTHRIVILGWIPGHVALAENKTVAKLLKNHKHPMNKEEDSWIIGGLWEDYWIIGLLEGLDSRRGLFKSTSKWGLSVVNHLEFGEPAEWGLIHLGSYEPLR